MDFTEVNPAIAWAAGAVISTASELGTWIEALVSGQLFDAAYQRTWRESLRPVDPSRPSGARYEYGIVQRPVGTNSINFHNGEVPGYNAFAGYDPVNRVTLVVWTSLAVAVDSSGPAERIAGICSSTSTGTSGIRSIRIFRAIEPTTRLLAA